MPKLRAESGDRGLGGRKSPELAGGVWGALLGPKCNEHGPRTRACTSCESWGRLTTSRSQVWEAPTRIMPAQKRRVWTEVRSGAARSLKSVVWKPPKAPSEVIQRMLGRSKNRDQIRRHRNVLKGKDLKVPPSELP